MITHLNYDFDKELLLQQAEEAKENAVEFSVPKYPHIQFKGWDIGHYTSPYIEKIMKDFGVIGKPRFYWMAPFVQIPTHTDDGTLCSLNFILTENAAPITIGGEQHIYQAVLLDTTVPHSVVNEEHERIMLKISIFDKTYEEVDAKIPFKLPSSTGA